MVVALSKPFTKFYYILKRFCSTSRYPSFFNSNSQGYFGAGHSGKQNHHRTPTSLTNLSFGSSSQFFTLSTFCLGWRTSSSSYARLSFLTFFYGFFLWLDSGQDYDDSYSDSSSDSQLSLSCLLFDDSYFPLNYGQAFLIFFSTLLKLSSESESSSSIVYGFQYFCCCYNLFLAYSSSLLASSSFLLLFSYFLCRISSSLAFSSASNLASSSLSKLSLLVFRLLTMTYDRVRCYDILITHLPISDFIYNS